MNPNHYKKCVRCQAVKKTTGTNWLARNGMPITEYNIAPGDLLMDECKQCAQKRPTRPAPTPRREAK